jgi:hypothetical protein
VEQHLQINSEPSSSLTPKTTHGTDSVDVVTTGHLVLHLDIHRWFSPFFFISPLPVKVLGYG